MAGSKKLGDERDEASKPSRLFQYFKPIEQDGKSQSQPWEATRLVHYESLKKKKLSKILLLRYVNDNVIDSSMPILISSDPS
jgi:hypothetical protein